MNKLSILLIDNQISNAAKVARTLGHYLDSYCLSISKNIKQTLATPEPAQAILLNVELLTAQSLDRLQALAATYPTATITLLHSTPAEAKFLPEALNRGATDYLALSKAGLQVLGRRLAARQPDSSQFSPFVERILSGNGSRLAVQIFGPDNRVRLWNHSAEKIFGLKQEETINCSVDDLPLTGSDLSRIKDILDQVRLNREPIFIPAYPLETPTNGEHWIRAYVYPLTRSGSSVDEVCIISVNVTDLKEEELTQRRYNQELQILLETNRFILEQPELELTLQQIAEQARHLLNTQSCYIYFLEKDGKLLKPVLSVTPYFENEQGKPLQVGQGIVGEVANTGKALILNSAPQHEEQLYGFPLPTHTRQEQHLLCAPLVSLRGVIGLMIVGRYDNPPFINEELQFFRNLVHQASSAINNARLLEETQRNLNELAILYEASAAIATTLDTQEVLNTLIRQMVQVMDVSGGHIISWNEQQNTGTVQVEYLSYGLATPAETELGHTFNLAERPALKTVVDQQRAAFFQLSNPALHEFEQQYMQQHTRQSRLLVPLVIKGETMGWAELWEIHQERLFASNEVSLVRMLANQAAVALGNARYVKQTQETLEETTALYQVARALASTQDSQTIMSTVLHEYLQLLDLKQGSVITFDFTTKVGVIKANLKDEQTAAKTETHLKKIEGRQIPLSNNPLFNRLMRTRQPVVVEDTGAAWLKPGVESTTRGKGGGWAGAESLSFLVIPIQTRGEITGAIVAEDTQQQRNFNRWEISLGQAMADQLGIALQNVQLYELEYQRRQQAETLREVSFVVGSSLKLEEVLERILDQLNGVVEYDSAAIHLIEGRQRRIITGRGFPHPEQVIGLTFPNVLNQEEPGSIVLHNRRPLVIGNAPEMYDAFREQPHSHIKSWMGVPLIARDKVIGLISIDRTEANAFNQEDVNLVQTFAYQVAIALENARLHELEVREIERELEIAQGIQQTLLPQVVPLVPGLEISGRTWPARQIGGDFFHFFFFDNDRFGLAIGDVSGKGIPAALYMAVAITAIDAQIDNYVRPGDLLTRLHHVLYDRLQDSKMNIGLQVAIFNSNSPPTTDMTLTNAGMIAPILATGQGCRFLSVGNLPIGAPVRDLDYRERKVLLEPATAIIFTSDGIVEAQNEMGELFGFERLEKAACEIIHTQEAEAIAEHLIYTAQEFTGQAEQSDDMTVLVVLVKADE